MRTSGFSTKLVFICATALVLADFPAAERAFVYCDPDDLTETFICSTGIEGITVEEPPAGREWADDYILVRKNDSWSIARTGEPGEPLKTRALLAGETMEVVLAFERVAGEWDYWSGFAMAELPDSLGRLLSKGAGELRVELPTRSRPKGRYRDYSTHSTVHSWSFGHWTYEKAVETVDRANDDGGWF